MVKTCKNLLLCKTERPMTLKKKKKNDFVWEKLKTMDFSATSMVYDIKLGRCSQLNGYMKLYEHQRSKSFIALGPNHSDSFVKTYFPQ